MLILCVYVIILKMLNRCIVGGCYRTSMPRDRTASFHQYPIPNKEESSVVNGSSSFNIISSTSGADEVVSSAGAYRFQPFGTLS